jgi:hypothetical protein
MYWQLFGAWQNATAEMRDPKQVANICGVVLLNRMIRASIGYEQFILDHLQSQSQPLSLLRQLRKSRAELYHLKHLTVNQDADLSAQVVRDILARGGRRGQVDIPVRINVPQIGEPDINSLTEIPFWQSLPVWLRAAWLRAPTFSVADAQFSAKLDQETLPLHLRQVFEEEGILLSDQVTVSVKTAQSKWLITDVESMHKYSLRRDGNELSIRCSTAEAADIITMIVLLDPQTKWRQSFSFPYRGTFSQLQNAVKRAKAAAFHCYNRKHPRKQRQAEDYGLLMFINDYTPPANLPPLSVRDYSFQLGLAFAIFMAIIGAERLPAEVRPLPGVAFTGALGNTQGAVEAVNAVEEKSYEVVIRGYSDLIVPLKNRTEAEKGKEKAEKSVDAQLPCQIHAVETLEQTIALFI